MGTHTCIVSRAGTNASDTSTAAAFAWQIGPGTGANPINAADFPGNAYPSGTGTVAAGAPSATITFQSNPDATFEPDETGVLIVTTTQNGVTITGSPQPFTITNDDADPGNTAPIYGPTSTTDTGPIDGGTSGYRVETVVYRTDWAVDVLCETNTGAYGYRLKAVGSDGNRMSGFYLDENGAQSNVNNQQENMAIDATDSGIPLVIDAKADGSIRITANGKVVKGPFQTDDYHSPRGTLSSPARWTRARTGSTTPRTVTVTKL